MNKKFEIKYHDRERGRLMTERVYAGSFLHWSYNTTAGRWATDLFFRTKPISQLYGWINKRRWSRSRIKPFVQKMDINLEETARPLEDFQNFNDFFVREIDLSRRPLPADPLVCIAPADGKMLAYPAVNPDKTFRIKRCTFNLQQLLGDVALAGQFAGGSVIISRLSLKDYHHFHFPDSGIPQAAIPIRGRYYAGGPYALHTLVPFYIENHRMVTLFDSDHFGRIVIIEIGAFTVGSIQQCYRHCARVLRGARKGFFELGGSTVVLLFRQGAIKLDDDLCANTQKEIETYVRFGDSIGRSQMKHTKSSKHGGLSPC